MLNVLIVEDNQDVAELIRDSLHESNDFRFEFWKAGNNYTDRNVDLIILDEDLGGGLSGISFLSDFKSVNRNWDGAVIMVTARDDEGMIKQAFKSGVDDYIVKPFEPDEFIKRIKVFQTAD